MLQSVPKPDAGPVIPAALFHPAVVAWFDTRVNPNAYQVWGRLVRYAAGGTPGFLGGDFPIGSPAGGGNAPSPGGMGAMGAGAGDPGSGY